LVLYGWRSRRQRGDERLIGYRLLKGGSSFVFPLVEEVTAMDVGNLIIHLEVNNALTRGGIRVSVEAVANVKVASREPAIHAAVERLLGKSGKEIQALARVTLESNLRGVLATLTTCESWAWISTACRSPPSPMTPAFSIPWADRNRWSCCGNRASPKRMPARWRTSRRRNRAR
jgi:hypothetical protein